MGVTHDEQIIGMGHTDEGAQQRKARNIQILGFINHHSGIAGI